MPVLRPGTQADAPAVTALLARAFPDNAKSRLDVLAWQYWQGPYGPPIVWVWDHDGRIVGHYAVIRYAGLLAGRPASLGIGIDLTIDPDYQGRRMLVPLARQVYADSHRSGVPAIVCYPNDKSVPGCLRAGVRPIGHLRTHLLPLDPAWFAARLHVPTGAAAAGLAALRLHHRAPRPQHDAVELAGPDDGCDDLWQRTQPTVRNGVIRDRTWLRWRYTQRPTPGAYRYFGAYRNGRLTGFAVTTDRTQRGAPFTYLLELIGDDQHAARALLRAISTSVSTTGLLLAALPGTALSHLAVRAGLRLVPQRLEDPCTSPSPQPATSPCNPTGGPSAGETSTTSDTALNEPASEVRR